MDADPRELNVSAAPQHSLQQLKTVNPFVALTVYNSSSHPATVLGAHWLPISWAESPQQSHVCSGLCCSPSTCPQTRSRRRDQNKAADWSAPCHQPAAACVDGSLKGTDTLCLSYLDNMTEPKQGAFRISLRLIEAKRLKMHSFWQKSVFNQQSRFAMIIVWHSLNIAPALLQHGKPLNHLTKP